MKKPDSLKTLADKAETSFQPVNIQKNTLHYILQICSKIKHPYKYLVNYLAPCRK